MNALIRWKAIGHTNAMHKTHNLESVYKGKKIAIRYNVDFMQILLR